MFANFRDAFKKDKQEISVPKEILDYLNSKLPKNFKYAKGPEGAAILTTTNNREMQMEISVAPYNDELKTAEEIMEYAYRTQQEIPLENSSLTINGKKFDFTDLIKFPLTANQEMQEFIIAPEPFPPSFVITLQGGAIDKQVMVERKPYADMHKILYGSVQDEAFTVSYVLDELKGMMKFNFNINIDKAKSIKEIIESLTLYDAFQKGSAKISGYPFPEADKSDLDNKENLESLKFWNMVYELEKKLGVSFVPELPLSQDDAMWFSKLYRSLIDETPFKQYVKMDKFSSPDAHLFKKALEEDQRISINYIQKSELIIMAVSLTIFQAIGIFNFVLKEVIDTQQKKSADILIEPADDTGIYTSTRIFLNVDEAKTFKMNNTELQNADELRW
ncbi:abortive infection system toxin AbiGii family protein [Paenibacillus macquariensis]|uniref:Abortive phage resistance protein AbiGii toxin n=1 Tax=Paenibacillus macquariensis TaxID=948756 RepID=A0ABY1K8Y9_9BACL|nr:abortive infection system toxin AbiGii family protein [Paenibacillus macquariensis]MEC0091509.1 abortive infection system toxin AbiGii family protein [Paenibacillus macquariensis]OAB26641.1 hypothetical protein PMSM_26095 [Paenibacillus macquariensis subsp. macquariensis]SIR43823.1 Putative abortive phage resistance protein AbiGii toxin [Paenibacillus macquariensis]